MSLQIINTDAKKDGKYKTHIAKIALADAEHDLGDVLTPQFSTKKSKDRSVYNAFNKGMPQQIDYDHYSEPYTLSRTMGLDRIDEPGTLCDTDTTCDAALMKWSTEVTDVTQSGEGAIPTNLHINITEKYSFNYNVVKFILPCSTNSKRNPPYKSYAGNQFGCDFFANTGLGGTFNKAAFIVDFNQHGFLEKLKQGAMCDNNEFEIIYLMTSEVVNDPAPKPNVDNRSVFNYETGIKTSSWVQTGPQDIIFTPFKENNTSPLNNFFSKYDFTMSPIKQTFVKKGSSLSVNLVASYNPDGNQPTLLATIEDSKKQNSIESVLGYIKNLINKIVKKSTTSDEFNFNVKCQQKRGGDWFQVLACLDAKNREYVQILPSGDRSIKKLDPKCPVYFVTHDRIAVAYALMNGVNVVYLDYYGGVLVFKNAQDETTTTGNIGELMFNAMKNNPKYFKTVLAKGEAQPIVGLINAANNYQKARITVVNNEIAKFTATMTAIEADINALNDADLNKYFTNVEIILRNLFKAAIELMFVTMNLPDVQIAIDYIDAHKNIFASNYEESIKQTIVDISRSFNTINGIFDRFGGADSSQPISANFDANISAWLNSNVLLLNVYKIASKIELDYTVDTSSYFSSFDKIKRMFSMTQTKNDKTTENISYDKNAFLPFIKTLDDTYKKTILDNLLLLHEKNNVALEKSIQSSRVFSTRHSKISTEQKKCNYIANLIYEALIIIELTPNDDGIVVTEEAKRTTNNDTLEAIRGTNGFVSMSRDVDIMDEDIVEINILKSADGKVSNNTTDLIDEPVVTVGGGTGFTTFGTATVAKKNTILDMNANQMTWPLFSYLLQDAYSLTSLQNSLKTYQTYITYKTELESENDEIVKDLQEKMKPLYVARNMNMLSDTMQAAAVVGSAIEATTGYLAAFIPREWTLAIGGTVLVLRGTYELYKRGYLKGGADDDDKMMIVEDDNSNIDLLKDFDLCYHPLMPIYMLLSPFYYTLGPKYESNSFFYTYVTYVNVLEKMVDVLDEKYLNDPLNNVGIVAGYLIGLTLSGFLFSAGTNIMVNDKILDVVGMSQEEYSTFSLKNDSFASLITGSIHLDPEEEMLFFALLDSDLFKNFINVEVNVKQILEAGTSVDGLPTYVDLKNRITGLMNRIVKKVNVDRVGAPEGMSDVAAGVEEVVPVGQKEDTSMDVVSPSFSRKDFFLQSRANKTKEVREKVALAKQKEQEIDLQRFKDWSRYNKMRTGPGPIGMNQFNALSRGIRVGGIRHGGMTKNRVKKRTSTRKKAIIKKTKKTRKHKRVHKRTSKNLN